MRRILLAGAFALTASFASASAADAEGSAAYAQCMQEAGGIDTAIKDCGSAEIDRQDRELNASYAALKSTLAPGLRTDLIKAQRAWLAFRDAECTFDYSRELPGSLAGLVYQSCKIRMTMARAGDLRRALDEAEPER